jgi:uncharacterized protein (TIGR02588 family)
VSSFSGGDDDPSAAEWAVMVVSVAVTLLLFGYVAWHAATAPPGATPEAAVAEAETIEDGRLAVTVEVHNPGRTGLDRVTVSVDCTDESLQFDHLPTDDRRRGTLVCPANATEPSATVENWIEI